MRIATMTRLRWILLGVFVSVVGPEAALAATCTITTASLTVATVQAAVNSAANGAVVCLPAGSATWTVALTIPNTKSITLQGAGIGATQITHNMSGSQTHLIDMVAHATLNTRITGFTFLNGTYDRRFIRTGSTRGSTAAFRIDHNEFISTGNAIQIDNYGHGKGLIDHNTMTSDGNFELIHVFGESEAGWTSDVTPGSDDAIYIEDNVFTNTLATGLYKGGSALQSYNGARTVARYNTLNFCQFDQHGTAGMIGARWWEFYENTFWVPSGGNQSAYFDIRAGSGVIFNNHKIGFSNLGGGSINFREEDTGSYPQLYQVGLGKNQTPYPAYVWNNASEIHPDDNAPLVLFGRDLIQSAKPGYTPYTYPHPLVGGGGLATLPAPTNLKQLQ